MKKHALEAIRDMDSGLHSAFDGWAEHEGATPSAVPGLTFHRHTSPTTPHIGFMEASLSWVVSGAKRVVLADRSYDYGPGHFLLTSVDLPVMACVPQASVHEPYRGLVLRIDMAAVRSLLAVVDQSRLGEEKLGIGLAPATADLADALYRLCRLHERPEELRVFAESYHQEMLYRLITSAAGPRLCALASSEGVSAGIVRALEWLRRNYRESQPTEHLASLANMGKSTFHRRFKAITSMTPVQYRKHLQLNEARRLMVVDGLDASSAAYAVGYESSSQFNREYRRMFGLPPASSVAAIWRSLPKADR